MSDSNVIRAARFKDFHLANPRIYEMLVRAGRCVRANQDITRWGIRNLWEKLRWDFAVEVDVQPLNEKYKLNDHYPPFYARMMVRDHPEVFDGWLEIRGDNCQLPDGV